MVLIVFIVFMVFFSLNSTFIAIIMERLRIITLQNESQTGPTAFRKRIDRYLKRLENFYESIKARIFGRSKSKSN